MEEFLCTLGRCQIVTEAVFYARLTYRMSGLSDMASIFLYGVFNVNRVGLGKDRRYLHPNICRHIRLHPFLNLL